MVQADQSKANSDEANSGQALLEFVFMLPILLVLIMNVVNFGGLFYAWITVANAARAGVNYAVLGVASAGSLSQASVSSINSMLTTEVSSLPNQASLVVNICKTYNGITTTLSGTCTSIPADPEATSFTLESIDVTYTYVPFINPTAFQFPNLNLYVTIPPTTLHNRAVMRVIN